MSCYKSVLDEEKEKRLEKRKLERMLKRRAEAAAVEKSERERKGVLKYTVNKILVHYHHYFEVCGTCISVYTCSITMIFR